MQNKSVSQTEENYLKVIYKLDEKAEGKISTSSISEMMGIAPASVTDMLGKLSDKKLISYKKYQGVSLTPSGRKTAVMVIRKHRLWEHFLVEKLGLSWDEVHEIAEQLEHIRSEKLFDKLDAYLKFPKFDPHGDPIPDSNGNFTNTSAIPMSSCNLNGKYLITGVADHSAEFLRYLTRTGMILGCQFTVKEKQEYDNSFLILKQGTKNELAVSNEIAKKLLVTKARD
ncbi:MAG: metal-dependent transcriptional regulator [Bacteroidetes bacterium]|nr:MAG: metal-dependent transcriptional regulator [Bacteroidota bacterium]REJ99808.1 MAG: metal-dependent transcriptional regulator [Bacteroidota bacterium]REK34181.1 MAG: metal-dependent transcriptional regulator [Bacteroidota bacterium]REK50511.1 MAG: metal-dependent transcriptional regulator [Bacteroidota bacterium]